MARSRRQATIDEAPEQYALSVVKQSEFQKARFRFYADGLTVFETAERHGAGWHPWRVQESLQLDVTEQTEALRYATEQGYVEDACSS